MADQGAKNLILLSRGGPRSQSGHDLIAELKAKGVRVETPACDVTDLTKMQEVLGSLMANMPPVKGCVQSSIVARVSLFIISASLFSQLTFLLAQDALFDSTSYDDWYVAVNCKTVGTWNLHTVLPSGMDFFILLASASGLAGIRGQANYNAGNCYEDAFARYRVAHGEKAVSFDLAAMRDDGILAETPELLNRVLGYGTLQPISRRTYHTLLDHYCNPALPLLSPEECQVAVGLGLGGGEGLETVDYSTFPLMYPMQVLGDKIARDGTSTDASGGGSGSQTNYRNLLSNSSSFDEAGEVVLDAVLSKLGKSLATMANKDTVDFHRPLQSYGVDSLLAVELRNYVAKEFVADVAVFETQGASTLSTLSLLVARRSGLKHSGWSLAAES
jgi:hypothetical protein